MRKDVFLAAPKDSNLFRGLTYWQLLLFVYDLLVKF